MSEVVVAGIGAACITVAGVLLANQFESARQKRALQHDGEERDRDRDLGLKREIYLGILDGVSDSYRALLRLANLDEPVEFESKHRRSSSDRVFLIGSPSAVEAFLKLSNALAGKVLSLAERRRALIERLTAVQSFQKQVGSISADREALMEEVLAEGSAASSESVEQLGEFISREEKLREFIEPEIESIKSDRNALYLDCLRARTELVPFAVAALKSARSEMGLPTMADRMSTIMTNEFNQLETELRPFLERSLRDDDA